MAVRAAWYRGRRYVAWLAGEFERRLLFTNDLDEAFRAGVKRRGAKKAPMGVLVWDESHNDMNNRTWKGGRRNSADERELLVERSTQMRKLGMTCYPAEPTCR